VEINNKLDEEQAIITGKLHAAVHYRVLFRCLYVTEPSCSPKMHEKRLATRPSQSEGVPSDNKVRANQFPRSVSRAKPFPCFISIPSRARSAVVVPDIGLPPFAPCQTPSFLFSPPASQQATNALLLLKDSSAIGASFSPVARVETDEEKTVSLREVGFTALSSPVISAPLFPKTA
jgi:hypothetical protein